MAKKKSTAAIDETWEECDVERIYLAYPRHVGKVAAHKAIRKALTLIARREPICQHPAIIVDILSKQVNAYAASPAGNNGKFTPYPATWLNAGRYDDDEKEWNVTDDGKGFRRDQICRGAQTQYEKQRAARRLQHETFETSQKLSLERIRAIDPKVLNGLVARAKSQMPPWLRNMVYEWDAHKNVIVRAWVLKALNEESRKVDA